MTDICTAWDLSYWVARSQFGVCYARVIVSDRVDMKLKVCNEFV